MPRLKYTSEFKSKIVLAILQGDKEFNETCSENSLNPSMVYKWKQEFLQGTRGCCYFRDASNSEL